MILYTFWRENVPFNENNKLFIFNAQTIRSNLIIENFKTPYYDQQVSKKYFFLNELYILHVCIIGSLNENYLSYVT